MTDNHGFIKVPREAIGLSIFEEIDLAGLWLLCLLCASANDYKNFHAGEFYVSQSELAKRLHINRTTITTKLRRLECLGYIKVTPGRKGTHIRVVGWEVLQNGGIPTTLSFSSNSQSEDIYLTPLWHPSSVAGDDHTPCDEATTKKNKEDTKKNKEDKDSDTTIHFFPMFEKLWNAYPAHRRTRKEDAARLYAEEIRRGVAHEKIQRALEWALYTTDWTKENGKYVPGICKWLERAEWRDDTNDDHPEGGNGTWVSR